MLAFCAAAGARGHEKLKWGRYSSAYRKRLLEGCRALRLGLLGGGLTFDVILKEKSSTVDELLEHFARCVRERAEKSRLRIAKHAVLAVQVMRPRLHKRLQLAWSALKSWEEQTSTSFRSPVPLALFLVIVCKAMIFSDRQIWTCFGALTLIAFFGLLRPGELFALRGSDATLPNAWSLGNDFAVLRIARPKNSRQMGAQQYVEIRHPVAVNWLAWLKSVRRPDAALWPGS